MTSRWTVGGVSIYENGIQMAGLADLTESSVRAAITKFRRMGRESFLAQSPFDPSRDYFLADDDVLMDTKPLAAEAYAIQFPEREPLTPTSFSGGAKHIVRILRSLHFNVDTRAVLWPPRLGDEYANRTEIYEKYGGDRVPGIMCFPGDATVNVFSDAEGPYADDPPTLTATFGYRGQGLNGPQRVDVGGNSRLETARLSGAAVRFWYRPVGGKFTFLTWAVVLGRAWVIGLGQDRVRRAEIDWQLEPVPGPVPAEWPGEVIATLQDAAATSADNSNVPEANPAASYADLIRRIESRGQPRRSTGVVRTDYARSAAARRAVMLRSNGNCESPACTGMPAEPNRRGEPILDVDHVLDLARGGEDHPRNMVALCPNCHAVKTRGANTQRWRRQLARIAESAHVASAGQV